MMNSPAVPKLRQWPIGLSISSSAPLHSTQEVSIWVRYYTILVSAESFFCIMSHKMNLCLGRVYLFHTSLVCRGFTPICIIQQPTIPLLDTTFTCSTPIPECCTTQSDIGLAFIFLWWVGLDAVILRYLQWIDCILLSEMHVVLMSLTQKSKFLMPTHRTSFLDTPNLRDEFFHGWQPVNSNPFDL